MDDKKTSSYIKYALGEIVLVVVGILIALQINNWNESNIDRELEIQYISGLITDLQEDSISISRIIIISDEQVRRKEKLYEFLEGRVYPNDSVYHFFTMQWGTAIGFNPISTSFDEMISTGNIRVIRNNDIRKLIIKSYNNYNSFITGSLTHYEINRTELRKLAFKVPRVFDYESLKGGIKPDAIKALKDDELRNAIMANYAITINKELITIRDSIHFLLFRLNQYLSELQN